MSLTLLIILVLLGTLIGAAIAWFVSKNKFVAQVSSLQAQVEQEQLQNHLLNDAIQKTERERRQSEQEKNEAERLRAVAEANFDNEKENLLDLKRQKKEEFDRMNSEITQLREANFDIKALNEGLKAQYDETINRLKDQEKFVGEAQKNLKDAFGALSADALVQNNQAFVALAESKLSEKVTEAKGILDTKEKAIDGIVKPLADSLTKMDDKINALETKREGAYSNIHTVLESMQRSTQALDKGTQSLVSALKNSSTRGKYGEIGLRRVVEFAGMTEHCDFIEQESVISDDGVLRPDMIINMPERKTIVTDSKVPLDAYLKIFETENEAEQKQFLASHAKAVKDHLKKLSAKAYWSQLKESPDYVVLYLQIESSFAAALQLDPTLIEEGIRNRVIFATPTTLITLLRTVGFVWQQRRVADNIEEIRDAGIELYNRTAILLQHFSSMGGSLKTAVTHYNNAVSSLESRFIPQAKKLFTLGSAYTKNIIPDSKQVEVAVRQTDFSQEEQSGKNGNEGAAG